MKPGSQNARLLQVLRDGPATNQEIHAIAGHMIVNSRAAELRAYGYEISCDHLGGTGAAAFLYTLIAEPPLGEPVEERPPRRSMASTGSLSGEQLRLDAA